MNEYSRELMHMTTSEKADYNRRYYQRNKQYWKDYYKTGHGIGRKPGALSGSQAIKWDRKNENASHKWKKYTQDGRPWYTYDPKNAYRWRETKNDGKSLDNVNSHRLWDARDNWEDRELEAWWWNNDNRVKNAKAHGAYGDYAMLEAELNRRESTTIRPRTANIPRKKIDRMIQSVSKTVVKEIKEEAGYAASAAKDFTKKIFDEIKKTVKKIKRR